MPELLLSTLETALGECDQGVDAPIRLPEPLIGFAEPFFQLREPLVGSPESLVRFEEPSPRVPVELLDKADGAQQQVGDFAHVPGQALDLS